MAILFISNLVPDRPPYNGKGFARSGNNVSLGIGEALPESETPELITCRPIASFPNGPLWIKGEKVTLDSGKEVRILPTLNIKVLKNLFWGYKLKKIIKKWTKEHKDESRKVLVYNIYTPPISSLYKICKKTSTKLYAILYDLGIPPASLKLSYITRLGYKAMEKVAYKYIPLLDGRVVINESIIKEYSPGKDFILIDGGINSDVKNRLFSLKERDKKEKLILTLAGMLWEQNGTRIILDCLHHNPDLNVIVYFAGAGQDVELIKEVSEKDSRIQYLGMLKPDKLFDLYRKSDILLNLRIEEENDSHFPSKLLEYMATGKHVISTDIAHAKRDYGEFITILPEPTGHALAEALRDIESKEPSELLEQGEKARRFMLEKRNWDARTREIIDYLHTDE